MEPRQTCSMKRTPLGRVTGAWAEVLVSNQVDADHNHVGDASDDCVDLDSTETSPGADARACGDHCRQIRHDAHALAASVQDATKGLQGYLTDRVHRRPYVTLGVAAGVGYVLGGGLRSRLTAVLLGAATRLALAVAARELGDRLSRAASASVHANSS